MFLCSLFFALCFEVEVEFQGLANPGELGTCTIRAKAFVVPTNLSNPFSRVDLLNFTGRDDYVRFEEIDLATGESVYSFAPRSWWWCNQVRDYVRTHRETLLP